MARKSARRAPIIPVDNRPGQPSNKWERRGWRQQNWRTDPVYPDSVVRRIAANHKIADIETLGRKLVFAADNYGEFKEHFARATTRRTAVAQLKKMLRQTQKLERSLSKMNEQTALLFADAQHRREMPAIARFMKGGRRLPDDPLLTFAAHERAAATTMGAKFMTRCLTVLIATLEAAIAGAKRRNSGSQDGTALEQWVYLMKDYWTRQLGRKFTLGFTSSKQGLGPTQAFLADALNPLDSAAINKLPWAMMKLRTDVQE